MWQRLQTVWCLCWSRLKVGTAMENTACPVSLHRACQVMVRYVWKRSVIQFSSHYAQIFNRMSQLTNQNQIFFLCPAALVCQGVADLAVKKRTESRRALSRLVESHFPDARVFPVDSKQDATLLLRHLSAQKQRRLGFRSRRSHLLAQRATYIPNTSQNETGGPATGLGTLCVSGYIRGSPLQVNRLVHITGHGDFQLSQIDAPADPLPIVTAAPHPVKPGRDVEMMVRRLRFCCNRGLLSFICSSFHKRVWNLSMCNFFLLIYS